MAWADFMEEEQVALARLKLAVFGMASKTFIDTAHKLIPQ